MVIGVIILIVLVVVCCKWNSRRKARNDQPPPTATYQVTTKDNGLYKSNQKIFKTSLALYAANNNSKVIAFWDLCISSAISLPIKRIDSRLLYLYQQFDFTVYIKPTACTLRPLLLVFFSSISFNIPVFTFHFSSIIAAPPLMGNNGGKFHQIQYLNRTTATFRSIVNPNQDTILPLT